MHSTMNNEANEKSILRVRKEKITWIPEFQKRFGEEFEESWEWHQTLQKIKVKKISLKKKEDIKNIISKSFKKYRTVKCIREVWKLQEFFRLVM